MASRTGLNMLQDTLIRAATARSSHAFSRASSDAGSVIDSISSTPRERGPSRSQQQHTLQAVASRLQHVQSGEMSYLQHQSLHKTNVAAIPDCWDSRHCSDTASWADGHVSCTCKHVCTFCNPETVMQTIFHSVLGQCSLIGSSSMQLILAGTRGRACRL